MRGIGRAALVAAIAAGVILGGPAVAAADGLKPGGLTHFKERVTVNVVFVGFDENEAPWHKVRAQLPSQGEPIVRSRAIYGIDEPLGLDYSYDYRPYYTSRSWEDGFFSYLSSIAVAKPLTEWQQAYNDQVRNALNVTSNRWIDAPKVEKRLIDTAPRGVDTRRPTIFFINWFGRSDFRFHVYAKTGEPDPDTGYDFGANRDTRKIVAWGGTTADDEETGLGGRGTHRVWFYDLSAGPENWSGNWNVDDADLDGDGVADYRIPVSWEYGSYRPRAALAGDLGKVIRYVGLDLLFTTSPLYPPYYTADRLPARVDLDTNTVEGLPGVDASREYITRDLFFDEVHELPAGFGLSADYQDLPYAGDFRQLLRGGVPVRPGGRAVLVPPRGRPAAGREPVPGRRVQPAPLPRRRRRLRGRDAELRDRRTRRPRSATRTTTGSTARRAACSASSRPASSRPATGSRRR